VVEHKSHFTIYNPQLETACQTTNHTVCINVCSNTAATMNNMKRITANHVTPVGCGHWKEVAAAAEDMCPSSKSTLALTKTPVNNTHVSAVTVLQ